MTGEHIQLTSDQEQQLRAEVEKRTDTEAQRIKRYLDMPDLSRTEGSPIHELVQRIISMPEFSDFDIVGVPEIVPTDKSFDLFDFPADHPARSKSDTYYVDEKNILRTHTTISWYYYLMSDRAKEKLNKREPVGVLTFGKVYRKDEIDRHHMNVFHQMDGYLLIPKDQKRITIEDLKEVLVKIVQTVFGQDVKYQFTPETFPYTNPSTEIEVDKGGGNWVEILGSGVVKGSVLEKLGVDSSVYNGWAFGFGLERLAIISMELPDIRLLWSDDPRVKSQLKLGNKFKEVSKYPPITRDISFIVSKDFVPNNYFDLIRDIGGDLVEEVKLLDVFENKEKFGKDKISYTYRITYRSNERTLTTEEIDPIQKKIYDQTAQVFGADLR
jgi:phenylalanyl-tRNA synthetase alpha chain